MNLARLERALLRKSRIRLLSLERKYAARYQRLWKVEAELLSLGFKDIEDVKQERLRYQQMVNLVSNIRARRGEKNMPSNWFPTKPLYGRFGRDEEIPHQFLFYGELEKQQAEWKAFVTRYKELHACCPVCGSKVFAVERETYTSNRTEGFQDLNQALCLNCGDQHLVNDRVPLT